MRLSRPRAALVYPILPAPRTAVLEPWFQSSGLIRVFGQGWCAKAAAYRPGAIAATWMRLEALAGQIEPVTHAVIALQRAGDAALTAQQRQRLWRAFRVPIFEQIVGEDGALLAAECEAHAGLHIESPEFDPGDRAMETARCGCGRPGPRLKSAEEFATHRTAAAHGR